MGYYIIYISEIGKIVLINASKLHENFSGLFINTRAVKDYARFIVKFCIFYFVYYNGAGILKRRFSI